MKKSIIIFSLLIGFAVSAAATVPGYMGRKFSIQYQFGISPQWNDFNSLVPYMFHTGQIGYVVSRRHEIGVQYTRTDYNNPSKAVYGSVYANGSSHGGYVDARSFSGNNATFYAKFFKPRKGFIAPLGSFIQLSLGYQYYTEHMHFSYGDQYTDPLLPQSFNVTSHDVIFGIGFGRNFIIANRLILNLELDINWPISATIRIVPPSTLTGNTDSYKDLKAINATDVALNNIIHIKFGFGGLLF